MGRLYKEYHTSIAGFFKRAMAAGILEKKKYVKGGEVAVLPMLKSKGLQQPFR